MTKPRTSIVVSVVGLLLVAIQLIPIQRDNPAVTSPVAAPAPVAALLGRACANCHSHETRWPWYGSVAPVSWLVASDVHEGRAHLNLSTWSEYSAELRRKKLLDMVEELEHGDMPPWYYSPLHPEARLSADEVNVIVQWAKSGSTESPR